MGNNKQVNDFEISGKVLHVGQPESYETKAGTTNMFRIIVLEVFHGTYADPVAFEFNQANMSQLLQILEGQWVTVHFILKGQKTIKDGKAKFWSKNEGLTVLRG